jgi:ABC-type nitrate/sulfonate/bicarbonate transport system permease component
MAEGLSIGLGRSASVALPRGAPSRRRLIAAIDPLRLLGVVLLIGAWQALTLVVPPSLLPAPAHVIARVFADFFSAPELSFYGLGDASLFGSMIYTTENVLIALAIGTAIGVLAGLATARFDLPRAVIDPIMFTAGTVPILVAAPFLLIWFGVGRTSAVALVVFYVVVILYVFAQRAADNLDPVYEESARTLGATPRQMIRDILLPATVPEILGGIRIALAGAWGLEAIAELLGSQQGIGKIIEVLAGGTDAEGIMAALLVLGLVAVGADALAAFAISRLAAWSVSAKPGGG